MRKEEYSSGAEKVEKIAGGLFDGEAEGSERQAEAAGVPADRTQAAREARERERAEKRLEIAKLREERKKMKKDALLSAEEEAKSLRAERAAERAIEESEREERAAKEDGRGKKGGKKRAPGFGGWLAAVITLSVAVLALGAVVTVGYFDLTEAKAGLYNGYRRSLCEFSELVDNLEVNLAKARVASGNYETQKVLTDVLVESELAENCLQSFPVDGHGTENLTAFVNRVGDYSRRLLNRLAYGGELTEEERGVVEYMYETMARIKEELYKVQDGKGEKSIDDVLKKGGFAERMSVLENDVIETPKMIYDGPFAASEQTKPFAALEGLPEQSEEEVLSAAKELFGGLKEIRPAGKTQAGGTALYGAEIVTEAGDRFFAQFTARGGRLALLDGYRPCSQENFDARAAVQIAEKFLARAGYTGLEPVWVSEAGSECDINFAYCQGGVVCYNDLVKVKVCKERGIVTGLEARAFLTCHKERSIPAPALSKSKIEAAARSRMELSGVRLALIPVEGEEVLCYEVRGVFGGREYFAYLNAKSGRMEDLFVVVGSASGKSVM